MRRLTGSVNLVFTDHVLVLQRARTTRGHRIAEFGGNGVVAAGGCAEVVPPLGLWAMWLSRDETTCRCEPDLRGLNQRAQ